MDGNGQESPPHWLIALKLVWVTLWGPSMASLCRGSVWLTSLSFQRPLDFPWRKKKSTANQNRAWRRHKVSLAIWLVKARWTGEGGGDRPCTFIFASVPAGQCDLDRLHITGRSEVHGPTPLVKWWIPCRCRRPKTGNSSVKKRRRRPRKRRRSPKTWPRRKDTNFSAAASRSASSL